MHLPTAKEFKNNTLVMLRTILLTTQALEKLPGSATKHTPPIVGSPGQALIEAIS